MRKGLECVCMYGLSMCCLVVMGRVLIWDGGCVCRFWVWKFVGV